MDMEVIECISDQHLIIHEGKRSHENPVSGTEKEQI